MTMKFLKPVVKSLRALLPPSNGKKHVTGSLEELQHNIGYRFRSATLLQHALTHKSYNSPDDTKGLLSNERLEFLGDSVLNCLITEHLFKKYPDRSEGQLSKIKSLVVSRKILGELALLLNFGTYMFVGLSEEKAGGRYRLSTLSNTFEALLGAVYLDGGLDSARVFLEKFLFDKIPDFLNDESNVNYKSKILEMSQRDGFGIPRYVTVSANGPDHAKEFRVRIEIAGTALGEGNGPNKKVAQQIAAQNATLNYNKELIQAHLKGEGKDELVSH